MFLNDLAFLNDFGDTEIADFDSFLAIEKDVVELDVSVNDRPAVDVSQAVRNLFEDELGV